MSPNPLLNLGFEIPFNAIEAGHVEPGVSQLIEQARAGLDAVGSRLGERTYDNTVGAIDRALEPLEIAMTVIEHLESVATSDPLRTAFNAAQPKYAAFTSAIPLDPALFAAIEAFAATPAAATLDPVQARRLHKLREEFKRHGAELPPAQKQRLEAIDVELAERTTRFSQNVLDATRAWSLDLEDDVRLAGLPDSAKEAAAEAAREAGVPGYRFTLQAPSYHPLLTYVDDAQLRERAYRAYNTRATTGELDNGPLLGRILELRQAKARLLGYETFADLVLADRMAENGAQARAFIDELRSDAQAAFEQESAQLLAFRRELEGPSAPELEPWDVAYYSQKQRLAQYAFDEEALRPYFAFEAVLEGMFAVAARIFDIEIAPMPQLVGWHPSVRAFEITNRGGGQLGAFFCDAFPRSTKRGGAWMNGLVTGREGAPHLGLICANVMPAVGDRPALLTHSDVETLFHEFGHLLHHCLSTVPERALAGTNVAWDFVELPSQIMENWCWEKDALDLFAAHHDDGSPLPAELFDAMKRARTFRAASAMMRQLGFASIDLALHTSYDPRHDGQPLAYAREHLAAFAPTPLFDEYAMLASFGHLFSHPVGYAAGYYSYKWAEVLDADAFTRFSEAGVFDASVGRAFRDNILANGDAVDPAVLFETFMGRPPSSRALLQRCGLQPAPDAGARG